jgi:acyl-CoA synthetase (AMP-forming)/AMP-acid ligase II
LDKDVFSLQTGYKQGSFDVVFMTLVLDRLEYPRRALETMLSLLDKQGRFCIQALLPIIPFDDGDHDDQIIYTEVANYITHGRLEHTNKLQLLTLLQQLGGGDISMRSLDYYVKSTDGQQKYRLWSFTGVKSCAKHYLYKTGDLGCWLKDGNIDFMGRVDDQVKIRGHRIELPEIEKQLTQAPGMDQVVVMAMDAGENDKQLVAYFVSQTDYSSSELHSFPASVARQPASEYVV